MTEDELREYIEIGNDIEWEYQGRKFSIVPKATDDSGKSCISVCEFYQEPVNVYTFDELINIHFYGTSVMAMLGSLTDDDWWHVF